VITLADILGGAPAPEALAGAIAAGFAETLGATFAPSALTAGELARAVELVRERHAHERWVVRRERAG
jgi:hypothetical protein